jgi:hypothetical protein
LSGMRPRHLIPVARGHRDPDRWQRAAHGGALGGGASALFRLWPGIHGPLAGAGWGRELYRAGACGAGAVAVFAGGAVLSAGGVSRASPYDGNWSYWATRRRTHPGVLNRMAKLLKITADDAQPVDSSSRRMHLLRSISSLGITTPNEYINRTVVHRHGHDQIHEGQNERSQRLGLVKK